MKVEGVHELPASRDHIWSMLMDPDVLTRCLPGCERLYPAGVHCYRADIRIQMNPIKGNYTGNLSMLDVNPPVSYRLVLEGRGVPGFVRGIASVSLIDRGRYTDLRYTGESLVGGPIASIGRKMLQGMTNSLIREFFEAFERELRANVSMYL